MRSKREQRHASIIFDHGTPIITGYNTPDAHAEENACGWNERTGKNRFKGLTMVNIRLTRAGRIALAKPCPGCLELLKYKKFRKVIYSTNEGTFEEIYL